MARRPPLLTLLRGGLIGLAVLFGAHVVDAAPVPTPAPLSPSPTASWHPNSDDALLYDVRIAQYRLGDGVRGYATPQGSCVDLGDMILALDIPVRLDKKSRRAIGWAFQEDHIIAIDRDAGTVQIGNVRTKFAATTLIDTPEGWCVLVPDLAHWLGLKISDDRNNATLTLHADMKLPVQSAMERKAKAASIHTNVAFDLKSLPQAHVVQAGVVAPAVDVVVSADGIRDPIAGNQVNVGYELYASGEVGKVSYDARLASDQRGAPSSLRVRAYRTDPNGGLLGPLHATHVEVGDVTGFATPLVAQASVGRGVMVTNRPVGHADNFSTTRFTGDLPLGWDAELYRNGQLLAFAESRSDGRYDFQDVPLLYGSNRFDLVLYGPQGQVRRTQQIITVGAASIPPRQTYYWAGILDSGHDLIDFAHQDTLGNLGWRGGFGIERGLDAKTSAAFSFQSIMLPFAGRHYYSETALRRAIGPALFEVSASNDLATGGVALRGSMLAQFGNTNIALESINGLNGFQSDRLLSGVTGLQSASLTQTVKVGHLFLPLDVQAKYTTTVSGLDTLDLSGHVSANVGRWLTTAAFDYIHTQTRIGPPVPDQLEVGMLANVRIGGVRLRGEARFEVSPVARLSALSVIGEWAAGHDPRQPAQWRAELGYDQSLSRARMALGYVRQFKRVALTATGEVASDGAVAGGLNLALSLGPSGRHGTRVSSNRLASSGSVLVRVYRDLNHNGVHDAGEPWEKGVLITTGRVPTTDATDANGEVIIDGLQPFQPLLIGVDASTLSDPLLQPESPGLVVTPRAGVMQTIELPVASSGEVDATLVRASGAKIEGADVELVDVHGVVVARARSEYDGFVLFEGVPYGDYSLRLSKLTAEALRVAAPLTPHADVGDGHPSVHLGLIKVGTE